MIALLAAEWTKTRLRPMHRLVFLVVLGFVAMGAMLIGLTLATDSAARERMGDLLPYPLIVDRMSNLADVLMPFFATLFTASIVAGEYTQDTWKMILPRRSGRSGFLAVKTVCAWALTHLTLLAFVVLSVALAFVATHVVAIPLSDAAKDATFPTANLLTLMLHATVLVALTTLLAVATRSMTASAALTLVFEFMGRALANKERHAARWLPFMHLQNLEALWGHDARLLDRVQSAFEAELSARASLVTLALYTAVPLVLAGWLFARRDQSGMPGA